MGLLEPDLVLIGESDPEKRRGAGGNVPEIQPEQTSDRPDVHHQRRANEDLGEQLHHDEDQFHQPIKDDRRPIPKGEHPHHSRCDRQRQPDRAKVFARRPELRRALFSARQPAPGVHGPANRP